jgi:WD40 repeat protein
MGSGASSLNGIKWEGAVVRTIAGSEAPVGIEGKIVKWGKGNKATVKIEGNPDTKLQKAFLRRVFRVGDKVLWIYFDDDIPAGTCGEVVRIKDPPVDEGPGPSQAKPRTATVDFFVDGVYIRRKIACPELEKYSYCEAASNCFKASSVSDTFEDIREAASGLFNFSNLNAQWAALSDVQSATTSAQYFHGPVILKGNAPDQYSKKKSMNKFRDIPEADFPVWCFALSPLGRFIACATADNAVHLWETMNFEVIYSIRFHEETVWALEFSPNGAYLATGSADRTIALWDTSQEFVDSITAAKPKQAAQNGKEAELKPKPPLQRLSGGHTAGIRCLSFAKNGLLMSGGMDNHLCVWEANNPWPLQRWQAHEDDVIDCYFSTINPDMAFSLGQDGTVAVWYAIDGEDGFKCRFKGGGPTSGGVLSLALHSRDFYMLATGTQDGSAFLHFFHPKSGADGADGCDGCMKYQHELRGHTGPVWTLSFSKDGCLLATGSADKTVRVWDVSNASYDAMHLSHTGKEYDHARHYPIILQVATFQAHDSFVRMLRWRASAKAKTKDPKDPNQQSSLVTCSPDGTVRIWTAPKQLRRAREWDLEHHPRPTVNDNDTTPTLSPSSSPKASKARALTDGTPSSTPQMRALADNTPPSMRMLGDLPPMPELPPLPALENAASPSSLRLAGNGSEATATPMHFVNVPAAT